MGGGSMFNQNQIAEGMYTAVVYGMIAEGKYGEAARVLQLELQNFPRSRAALSLLGFCCYYLQDFATAVLTYVGRASVWKLLGRNAFGLAAGTKS